MIFLFISRDPSAQNRTPRWRLESTFSTIERSMGWCFLILWIKNPIFLYISQLLELTFCNKYNTECFFASQDQPITKSYVFKTPSWTPFFEILYWMSAKINDLGTASKSSDGQDATQNLVNSFLALEGFFRDLFLQSYLVTPIAHLGPSWALIWLSFW